ncbi:MAG: CDP-alcohol phosphatidyltransferase family protein [Alphaproteobacteria bacterium]|nr:CDP-alcohol phosphatidyltransferase family protein [Alphaproteobacteria bacterium]
MASEQNLPAWARGPYVRVLRVSARFLQRINLSANALTALSLVVACAAGIATAQGHYMVAAAMLVFSGLCDILDGALARQTGTASRFGALLDSTIDRLSDAAIPAGYIVVYASYELAVLVPVLAALASYTVSYVRARAEGLDYALPRLWLRREDRMALLTLALLLSGISIRGIVLPAPLAFLLLALLGIAGFGAAVHALLIARHMD